MTIDSIDRSTLKMILEEAREALAVVADKHIKPKARKYPVLGSHIHTGKTYKFRLDAVKDGLKAQGDLKSSMSFT